MNDYQKVDVYISLEITKQCNMNCCYCYNKHVITTEQDDNKVIRFKFLMMLEKELKNHPTKQFEVDILGGEPSISKNLKDFINKLGVLQEKYKNFKWITLTTNAKEFPDIKDMYRNLRVSTSYHNYIDHNIFKQNILKYKNEFLITTVTINLFLDNYFNEDKILDIISFCKLNNILICYIPIYVGKQFTSQENNKVNKILKELPIMSQNQFFEYQNKFKTDNYKCRLNSFNILFDGTISTSCGNQEVFKNNFKKFNIMTTKLPIDKIITCTGNICEGGAGYLQRERSKDLNNEM